MTSNHQRAVVDGIRGTEEVAFLKKKPNFYLLAVLADPKIRYQRMINRGRRDEKISWDDFQKMEERDKKAEGRNIEGCLARADFKIENNGTIKEFQKKIEKILRKLKSSIN
jgi:dephospho-CoA kinase